MRRTRFLRGTTLKQAAEQHKELQVKTDGDTVKSFVSVVSVPECLASNSMRSIPGSLIWMKMVSDFPESGVSKAFSEWIYEPMVKAVFKKQSLPIGAELLQELESPGGRAGFGSCPACIANRGLIWKKDAPKTYTFHTLIRNPDDPKDDIRAVYIACSQCNLLVRLKDLPKDPRSDRLVCYEAVVTVRKPSQTKKSSKNSNQYK